MTDTKYFAEQAVTAWAIPNKWREAGEPEYLIRVMLGDGKPYQDNAVKISERNLHWEVTLPDNLVEMQVAALEETLHDEYKNHARRITELTDEIQKLRALPAPE